MDEGAHPALLAMVSKDSSTPLLPLWEERLQRHYRLRGQLATSSGRQQPPWALLSALDPPPGDLGADRIEEKGFELHG